MNKLLLSFLTAIFIAFSGGQTIAQQKITPAKEALIKELLEVTGSAKSVREVAGTMMKYQQSEAEEMIASTIDDDKSFTTAEKVELKKMTTDAVANMTKRIADFYTNELNLERVIEEISVPIYDKNFTEQELREFISFYRTSTGQKAITLMPTMMMESMKGFSERVSPKLRDFTKRVIDEELAAMKQKIEASQKPKSKL